jgi:hypothetical protein
MASVFLIISGFLLIWPNMFKIGLACLHFPVRLRMAVFYNPTFLHRNSTTLRRRIIQPARRGDNACGSVTVIDPGEEELSPGRLKHFGFGLHKGSRMGLRGADQKIAGPGFHRKRGKDKQQNDKISHDVLPWQGAAFLLE